MISFTILVPSNTINAFPVVILIHNVFNPIFEIQVTKNTEISSLMINCLSVYELSSFLYNNSPYIKPVTAVLIVYPMKNAPVGNKVAPIISPKTFNNTVHLTPNHIAHNIVGINAKLIFKIGVFIDKKRDSIISVAKSIADSIIFLFLDIKNPPFLFSASKEKERVILSITYISGMRKQISELILALIATSRLLSLNYLFSTLIK